MSLWPALNFGIAAIAVTTVNSMGTCADAPPTSALSPMSESAAKEPQTSRVHVASFGVGEITPDDNTPLDVLHVRTIIDNVTDGQSWEMVVSTAHVEISNGAPIFAVVANSDSATLPVIIVERGHRKIVDLYFPVPAEVYDPAELGAFDFSWTPSTPTGRATNVRLLRSTAAQQFEETESRVAGWGHYWWSNPAYPWSTLSQQPRDLVATPPQHIVITSAPSWDLDDYGVATHGQWDPQIHECEEW